MQSNYQNSINIALKELHSKKDISTALGVCNTLLEYMGVETKTVEDIELSKLKLPNAERYDRWFEAHPHFRGDRACFDLTPKATSLEAKFFALQKRSKLFIAGSVSFTPNFEDRDYTRNDPNMKVGIDFFFTPEQDSVIVVLSNKGSLRLVELSGRLTNTQNDIFTLWHNVAQSEDKNVLHSTIWESFKLSSLNKKFYEGIANSFLSLTQHLQAHDVEEQLSNQFANRLHGRLLFLWFLRKKNIINESKEYFTLGDQDDTAYYANTLSTLFFNVLNNEDHKDFDSVTPYLNGGLFDQESDGEYWNKNKPTFPAGFFRALYDHFDSFNFTTDESTPEYEQIAIDPEMLGRIFESFLATLTTETGAQAKKANGAFYTPREIVSYMSRESLRQYLYTALDAGVTLKTSIDDLLDRPDSEWALAGTNSKRDVVSKEDRERIMDALRKVKVLDPAVGSGAFPMGVLHKILSLFERLEPNFDSYETKLSILRNNIYGADIDPTAIEISRLRAWLSIIVDVKDLKKIKPLPNLDFKFVCANSLIGLEKGEASFTSDENLKPELIRIRDEYYATSSKIKKEKLQKEYTKLTHSESLFDNAETRQLKSYKPFENGKTASFYDSELMHGVESFDVMIGNPPYVNLEKVKEGKEKLKSTYKTASSRADLYCLFFEKGLRLVKEKTGLVIFITSNKWMRSGYGSELRQLFSEKDPLILIDLGGHKVFDGAVVDTDIFLIKNRNNTNLLQASGLNSDYKKGDDLRTYFENNSTPLNNLSSETWFIGDLPELSLKDKIEKAGVQIKDWDIKINFGIKTGFNEAFIIDQDTYDRILEEDPKSAEIIKPVLRGRDIERYTYKWARLYIVNPHNGYAMPDGTRTPPIDIEDYPAVKKHLDKYISQLTKRFDKGKTPYNLRNCAYLEDFMKDKIVWIELADNGRFAFVESGMYTEATTFLMTFKRPKYLAGALNSKLVNWYFDKICGESGVGTNRWKKFYVEAIPLPLITPVTEPLVQKIESSVETILSESKLKQVDSMRIKDIENQIDELVYKLYGISADEIAVIETKK